MRGKLIVFEGGEGSGKTTQIKRLYDWLSENKALQTKHKIAGIKFTREPGGTELGRQIRQMLLNERFAAVPAPTPAPATPLPQQVSIASKTELLLYAADRAQHVQETLLPWLDAGYWVLCDRYTDSTVAYQGYGRQLDLNLIEQLNQIATGGLKSDLTLWLKVPPLVGLARMHQRGQADRIEQAGEAFHQRVSEGFAALAAKSAQTEAVDGDRPEAEVAAKIQQIIQQRLAQWYPHPSLNPL